ncbi:hypothetical protein BDEG_27108 [Batrachochytrium dendrobatidis JEL423]|uniref:Rab-GAP TBC domain-containing protein n=1 Tax=Batrachochytrium dendrobatidis (strain JEL423) TaxID=403673 RepID=A0A177WUM3_BATDL|nr:hypothetical protein BDEG_27108 [Batrachochytrium dendrobatidis JEL423]
MAGYIRNGTLLKLCNSAPVVRQGVLKTLYNKSSMLGNIQPLQSRQVAFACLCTSREMASLPLGSDPPTPSVFYSYVLCAIDQRGHIYIVDFVANRFWTVARTGVAATACCFNSVRRREIIIAMSDKSIHCYNIDSLNLQWKITLDQMSSVTPGTELDSNGLLKALRVSYFDMVKGGDLLAYAGLSSTVYVWNLVEKRLLHEILVPAFRDTYIAQLAFVGSTNILAILSNTGMLIFIDAAEAKFVGHVQGKHQFNSFAISPDGCVLSCVLMDAKYIVSTVRLDEILYPNTRHTDIEHTEFDEKVNVFQEESCVLNRRKLGKFLAHYGEYPSKYRALIWRFLLKLPENRAGYEALLDQNVHPNYKSFRKSFPLKSDRQAKSMERILSSLAFWSPIFGNLDYLPAMIFPFVLLFSHDIFSGFEVIMTVLLNWCQKWWEYYPNPPIDCLDMVEELLGFHDPELLSHFVQHNVTSQTYCWIMMQSLFSELFSNPDWLKLWDHLLTQPPSFMYCFIVAYITTLRTPLLSINKQQDFKFVFQRRSPILLTRVIQEAYRVQSVTPERISPRTFLKGFEPCLKGAYPVFNAYPEFIVNYQTQMKEKIRSDEAEYLSKRYLNIVMAKKMADELARLSDELKQDKKTWDSVDFKMDQMVEKWWEQMMGEEDMRQESKTKLGILEKEKRATAMRQIAEARKAFADHQIHTTEQHIASISRAIGHNRRSQAQAREQEEIDAAFKDIEREWMRRRDEMVHMRGELEAVQRGRVEKLVRHVEDTTIHQ